MESTQTKQQLQAELEDLRARLAEAEDMLRAIRSGELDAVVDGGGGRLLAFEGAESTYRILIEEMSEGALTLTAEGLILYANRRLAQMLKAPLEQMIGSALGSWVAADSQDALDALLHTAGQEHRSLELDLVAKDGTSTPAYLSASRLRLDESLEAFGLVVTDLSERKRSEAILAEERLARSILEQAGEAIVVCDAAGRVLRASRQARVLCGENPLGQPLDRAFALRTNDGKALTLAEMMVADASIRCEALLERDGRVFDLTISARRLLGGQDETLGSVVVLTDISEQKLAEKTIRAAQAELKKLLDKSDQSRRALLSVVEDQKLAQAALRRSEERYRSVFADSGVVKLLVDPADGRIVEVNRTACDYYGWDEARLKSMNIKDINVLSADEVQAEMEQARAQRKKHFAFRHRLANGEVRDVDVFSSPVASVEAGGRTLLHSIVHDVTERNRATKVLARRDAMMAAVATSTQHFLLSTRPWREVIDDVLARVGKAAEVSRVYLFENLPGAGAKLRSRQIHEWVAPGVRAFLDVPDLQAFCWADYGASAQAEALERGDPVFSHRRDLPEAFARLLAAQDIESIALVPVHVDSRFFGLVGFDQCVQAREWIAAEREALSLVAATLGAAIQQQSAKQSLIESESRFRGLVEQSLVGIVIADREKLLYGNPRAAEILGYAQAELEGMSLQERIADADWPLVAGELTRVMSGDVPAAKAEFTARRKDGQHVIIGAQAVRTLHAGQPALLAVMQDITEKKRAEEQIQRYLTQLETAFMSTVNVATTLSEMRDPYTTGHERRVAEIAVMIGAELGLDARRQEGLRVAGHLHDIGKITIPAEILSKPGKLSAIEYQLIQAHPQAGYDVLKDVEFPWPVAQVALQHHERIDGSGYPQGLKGEAILIEARIMAVADVVEAMSSHRPYRAGLGLDKALAEIERGRGSAYDQAVADACLKLFREKAYKLPA